MTVHMQHGSHKAGSDLGECLQTLLQKVGRQVNISIGQTWKHGNRLQNNNMPQAITCEKEDEITVPFSFSQSSHTFPSFGETNIKENSVLLL